MFLKLASLQAQSVVESGIRDSRIQTFLSGSIIIVCSFCFRITATITKKKRRDNEEVMSSYERENGFKKWPKKKGNRVNRRIICVFNSESD